MDINELKDIIKLGVGMVVATRDAQMRPDICDGAGINISSDASRMTIFLVQQRATRTLANIENNRSIAVSMSRPPTYAAAQIKGHVTRVRPLDPAEQPIAQECATAFQREIQLIGVTREAAMGLRLVPDIAVDVSIENIFIQTPGPKAGQSMGSP
ncbi:hypothetical protein [Bdellovibrio sp.]|uniref:hypothetical protein n=1 Tax=Bdellovibrio sp. TaxID=28201 RepID=UPI0039E23EB2